MNDMFFLKKAVGVRAIPCAKETGPEATFFGIGSVAREELQGHIRRERLLRQVEREQTPDSVGEDELRAVCRDRV